MVLETTHWFVYSEAEPASVSPREEPPDTVLGAALRALGEWLAWRPWRAVNKPCELWAPDAGLVS